MSNVREILIQVKERSCIGTPAFIIISAEAYVPAKKLVQKRCFHALHDHYSTVCNVNVRFMCSAMFPEEFGDDGKPSAIQW